MILTCHSYVTGYIYPRYSHLKSLASYFGLQVSRTYPHVYYSFLLRTSAIQSLTQTLLNEMNPYPLPNSVIVCDNASVHHFDGLRAIVEARSCRLPYLPPYSPDFNPIEEGFSSMKAWIRANNAYVLGELAGEHTCDPHKVLWEAVFESMTPENIVGWYRDSGYVV